MNFVIVYGDDRPLVVCNNTDQADLVCTYYQMCEYENIRYVTTPTIDERLVEEIKQKAKDYKVNVDTLL